ncbi:MAG: hypothetical protein H0W36_12810 [Gemmatimonadetes bacterium]|nr:hypothetical protein [Gemmatimonadota bacterium]
MPTPVRPKFTTPDLGALAGKTDFGYATGVAQNQYQGTSAFDTLARQGVRGGEDFDSAYSGLERSNTRRIEDNQQSVQSVGTDRRYTGEDAQTGRDRLNATRGDVKQDYDRNLGDVNYNSAFARRDVVEGNNRAGLLSSGRGAEALQRQDRGTARTLEDLATGFSRSNRSLDDSGADLERGFTRANEGFDERLADIARYGTRGDEDYATNRGELDRSVSRFGEDQQSGLDGINANYAFGNADLFGALAERITQKDATVPSPTAAPTPPPAGAAPAAPPVPSVGGGRYVEKGVYQQTTGSRAGLLFKLETSDGRQFKVYSNGDRIPV